MAREVQVKQYDFEYDLFDRLETNYFIKDFWPLVYILSDNKTKMAYVGETANTCARMNAHMRHADKGKLTTIHLITSDKFNKSATLDIESKLIKYMSGDGAYQLQNSNFGLADHNYYQKDELYDELFHELWYQLIQKGITKHSIIHLDNSDLFKYSPYKSLTEEQGQGLLKILENLANGNSENTIVEGGAGAGKTVLATFLFKLLSDETDNIRMEEPVEEEKQFLKLIETIRKKFPNPKMALVVPMHSFRVTMKKVFKNVKGLRANMVIGPAEVSRKKYDILLVDEAHRLRRGVNLGTYADAFKMACQRLGLDKDSCSELDWVTMQAANSILFYDKEQSVKPGDVQQKEFDRLKDSPGTTVLDLKSQLRVRGGKPYEDFVRALLNARLKKGAKPFKSKKYEFALFDSLPDMISMIKQREEKYNLCRLVGGYAWEWKSKKDKSAYDIEIDDTQLRWNSQVTDWIHSANSINEVGCIHTTQGYDLNYTGIIFGNEISYDPVKEEIVIKPNEYHDRYGKQSIVNGEELKQFIINIYRTIMMRGIRGTYVYVCDPLLREYFRSFIPAYEKRGVAQREIFQLHEVNPFENAVPLYDLSVAAGAFGEKQQADKFPNWIKIHDRILANKDLFSCRVVGESMNKIIPNGSICLFRKDSGGSRNGKIVLVECTELQDPDLGSCYTIKEYASKKTENEDGWKHTSIVLKPRSTEARYKNIVLSSEDALSAFRVIGVFECVLSED